jgi:hypothetical protein
MAKRYARRVLRTLTARRALALARRQIGHALHVFQRPCTRLRRRLGSRHGPEIGMWLGCEEMGQSGGQDGRCLWRPSSICFFFDNPRETIRYDWLIYFRSASSERPGFAKCWIHFNPRDARYGAGRNPGSSLSISYDVSLTLNVKPRCLSSHPAMANTLPPTFHTCDPPHWTTYAAAGRDRQKALNSS